MSLSLRRRLRGLLLSMTFAVIALGSGATVAMAQEKPKSGWVVDPKTACKVWDEVVEKSESVTWSGECLNGLADGQGAVQWTIGGKAAERYDGEMRGGKMNGNGILVFPNGLRYEGAFHDNDFHGHGKLTYSNGDIYEGEFVNDDRSGKGTFTMSDGRRYVGEWKNDMPHGNGTLTRRNGSSVSGSWKMGCLNEGTQKFALIATPKECKIY